MLWTALIFVGGVGTGCSFLFACSSSNVVVRRVCAAGVVSGLTGFAAALLEAM